MRLGIPRLAFAALLALPPLAVALGPRSGGADAVAAAGIVAVAAGLLVVYDGLRETGLAAAGATLLTLYGTSLFWSAAVEPGAGLAAFVAGALAAAAAWRRGRRLRPKTALALGALLGAALLLIALAAEVAEGPRPSARWSGPAVLETLFSSRHGLLFWTPGLSLALAGLVLRAARGAGDASLSLAALGVMTLGSALLRPWSSGGFGNARFLPGLPLLALGFAAFLDAVRGAALRRPLPVLAGAGGLLVAWNLLFMAQYRAGSIPRDDTVSFPAVAANNARLVAEGVGSPIAWPANWIFAAREGLPAERFDLLGGQDLLEGGAFVLDVGDLRSEAGLLGGGWSVRHPCGAAVCREVEGRATVFLPVVDAARAEVHVRVAGTGTLRVVLDGAPAAAAELSGTFEDVVSASGALTRGVHELTLEVSAGGRASIDAIRAVAVAGRR